MTTSNLEHLTQRLLDWFASWIRAAHQAQDGPTLEVA
jgi:hypothetical protein